MRYLGAFALALAIASPAPAIARVRARRVRSGVPTLTPDGNPNIQAQAAIVVDGKDGTELYAKNPDTVRPIASISKLMAVLVVVERGLRLDETQTISQEDCKCASRGSRSRLLQGMRMTNRDLLHAALLASDNRAIPALGRAVGLAPKDLAKAMTEKAHALGLRRTEFKDPTGLDDGNVSTPRETVRMLQAALSNPVVAEILRKTQHVVQPIGMRGSIPYANTDRLVRSNRWTILGGKTGYTDIARYCLVVAARIGTREVVMAFLGAEGKLTRFADFTRSAEWLLRKGNLTAQSR